jgi:hypothetical protein
MLDLQSDCLGLHVVGIDETRSCKLVLCPLATGAGVAPHAGRWHHRLAHGSAASRSPDMTSAVVSYMPTFLMVLDFVGTFVFALSGAIAAVRRELDLFGVLVLAFVAASIGGIVRDLLTRLRRSSTGAIWSSPYSPGS